jgi:D-3-phosphoglycerate dehydrogenase
MRVIGYDPMLSVESAWRLSREVERCENIQQLVRQADYMSLHVPVLDATKSLVNKDFLSQCKKGARLLNFARSEIVVVDDVKAALKSGVLKAYVSDFPHPKLVGVEGVTLMPHIGASTVEAEENCALMAADQLYDFLRSGNISNSVNYPNIRLEPNSGYRLAFSNRNVPKMLNSVLEILGDATINVTELLNKSRGDVAYNLIDIDRNPDEKCITSVRSLKGIIGVRVIKH